MLIPIPIKACKNCGKVNEEFIPPFMKLKSKIKLA
jgi:hypothetical protein